ncbi:allantoinase [Bacillaceae bacterium Marseille-Q3522]|nr:allantoinase [Bacillaceae bacterium Marseille-Q3522]
MYDVVIKNGLVILPEKTIKADIAIKNGKISVIAAQIEPGAAAVIDAGGDYLFPGVIDAHVHFNEPGRENWEGFATGSFMMAAGGCTAFFDMPLNGIPSTVTKEALLQKAVIAAEKSAVDFGLWGGLVPGNIDRLASLADSGVVAFKAFMSTSGNEEFAACDDRTLVAGMHEIARAGRILALHAESNPLIEFLTAQKLKKQQFSADDYAASRPVIAEAEAVERAISFAKLTGCPLHFVHISSALAVEKILAVKQQGQDVTLETCPHYLLFSHDDLRAKQALAKCAPPLREKAEQEKLIRLLKEDAFDMITSDHSPCPYAMKTSNNLFEVWGGINGGQFTLLSMIEISLKHGIPFEKIARLTASAPAKRFGLANRKGKIAIGFDADLTIVSTKETHTVTEANFFAKHKKSLYTHHVFPCKVRYTFNRGHKVYQEGMLTAGTFRGEWLKPGENA